MSAFPMKPEDGLIGPPRTYTAQDRERDTAYRAVYLAGLEAAAKVCDQMHEREDDNCGEAARHEAEAKRQRKNARRAKQWLR